MPVKAEPTWVPYLVKDAVTGAGVVDDQDNHTIVVVRDNGYFTASGTPEQIDSVAVPGWYSIELTASENNGNILAVIPSTSTADTEIEAVVYVNDSADIAQILATLNYKQVINTAGNWRVGEIDIMRADSYDGHYQAQLARTVIDADHDLDEDGAITKLYARDNTGTLRAEWDVTVAATGNPNEYSITLDPIYVADTTPLPVGLKVLDYAIVITSADGTNSRTFEKGVINVYDNIKYAPA